MNYPFTRARRNIGTLCLSRIRTVSEHLREAYTFLLDRQQFNCIDGRTWNFDEDKHGIWKESRTLARLMARTERPHVKRRKEDEKVKAAISYATSLFKT